MSSRVIAGNTDWYVYIIDSVLIWGGGGVVLCVLAVDVEVHVCLHACVCVARYCAHVQELVSTIWG
jgi:hypothetical protein